MQCFTMMGMMDEWLYGGKYLQASKQARCKGLTWSDVKKRMAFEFGTLDWRRIAFTLLDGGEIKIWD